MYGGTHLLSQLKEPVSSTVLGLTSVFGMGTGISPTRSSTTIYIYEQIHDVKYRTKLYTKAYDLQGKTLKILYLTVIYRSILTAEYIALNKNNKLTRSISTSQLNALQHFHLTPINPIVSGGSYLRRESNLILKQVSHLYAFSDSLFPA